MKKSNLTHSPVVPSRSETRKDVDRRAFRRTASSTKLINILPTIMRGGTRL